MAWFSRLFGDRRQNGVEPPFEDTLFTVLLAGLTLFGNAIAGDAMRTSAGLDRDASERFIAWLGRLLHNYLGGADLDP